MLSLLDISTAAGFFLFALQRAAFLTIVKLETGSQVTIAASHVIWDRLPFAHAATLTGVRVKLGDEFPGMRLPFIALDQSTGLGVGKRV